MADSIDLRCIEASIGTYRNFGAQGEAMELRAPERSGLQLSCPPPRAKVVSVGRDTEYVSLPALDGCKST